MDASSRRKKLTEIISKSEAQVTGSELAAMLKVTRQVVVQDIALLRAGGIPVIATPSGYMMMDAVAKKRPLRVFTCRHETLEQAETELMLIVENGEKVRDVIIEHPIYGEITGALMIGTPQAVKYLIERLSQNGSLMLSTITDGVHMHTVEAYSEAAIDNIETKLRQSGILV